MNKISVVINTFNEGKTVGRVIKSVGWADEVVVCDMHSDDDSAEIARKLGARVVLHKRVSFVEPARNFAVLKASNDWILVLDPDEEIPAELGEKLQEIAASEDSPEYVEIPRKNIIFGGWMKASMWWPDYNIRFFKKGAVTWGNEIHRPPKATGEGIKLPEEEKYAIAHYHYESVSQFIERMNRYTSVQAEELKSQGYIFNWRDLISKPNSEFLSRFFLNRGFEDGLRGLALSLLQAFSFLVVYLKVWEIEKFEQKSIALSEIKEVSSQAGKEIKYWNNFSALSKNPFKRIIQKARGRVS